MWDQLVSILRPRHIELAVAVLLTILDYTLCHIFFVHMVWFIDIPIFEFQGGWIFKINLSNAVSLFVALKQRKKEDFQFLFK